MIWAWFTVTIPRITGQPDWPFFQLLTVGSNWTTQSQDSSEWVYVLSEKAIIRTKGISYCWAVKAPSGCDCCCSLGKKADFRLFEHTFLGLDFHGHILSTSCSSESRLAPRGQKRDKQSNAQDTELSAWDLFSHGIWSPKNDPVLNTEKKRQDTEKPSPIKLRLTDFCCFLQSSED